MINQSLKSLFFINGIFVFAANLLGPLYAIFVQGIDSRITAVSSTMTVFIVSTICFTYITARLGDRVKEKEYLLMAGFLIRAFVWAGYLYVGSLSGLIVLQVVLGLGEALGSPSFMAIFAEHLDKGRYIEDFAGWGVFGKITEAAGVFVGGLVVSEYGFNVLFTAMSTLAVLSFVLTYILPRKRL